MNKKQIASVIETSPVRLTADETRLLLRASHSSKPIIERFGSTGPGLVDLGLFEKVPVESVAARQKRSAAAWQKAKTGVVAKDVELVKFALRELSELEGSEGPAMGYSLTALGKEVARGITVRITKL